MTVTFRTGVSVANPFDRENEIGVLSAVSQQIPRFATHLGQLDLLVGNLGSRSAKTCLDAMYSQVRLWWCVNPDSCRI